MPVFFVLLLKINLVLILFSASYYLVLRRLTFYVLNRIFLVFGIFFSSVYPFINLTKILAEHQSIPAFIPEWKQQVGRLAIQSEASLLWQGLTFLFYAGIFIMACRLIVQLSALYRLHCKSSSSRLLNVKVRILKEHISPFCFWQTIYINPDLHHKEDLNHILAHEHIHVREWHTLDLILAELSLVIYWFNPGVWLMKKAIKENIEFITDAKVLRNGIDKKAYQYSLLDVSVLQPAVSIVNTFNLSDLKKRIKMMNTRRSSKFMLSRYVLVLPLLVFISLAFTFNKKMANHPIKPVHVSVQQASPVNELSSASIAVSKRKIAPIKRVSSTVLYQINSESDDLSQADDQLADTISHTEALPKRLATIVILKRKNESIDKLSTASFVLNDTSGMVLSREQLGEYEKAGLNGIRKVVLIRATKSSNNPLIGDPQSPITYHVDGKQITGEDLKAIDPAKIKSFKLVKGNGGEIYMNTKP